MADAPYFDEATADEITVSGRMQTLINGIGGVVSLVLIGGMVLWGWQLMVRDVSGVPVVEALEGPMRVQPEDPGGVEADHQGLAVNRIAEGQEAAPGPDRIVLAPPPVELADLPQASAAMEETAGDEAPAGSPLPVARADYETDEFTPTPTIPVAPAEGGADAATAAEPEAEPTPEAASAATLALIDRMMQEESGRAPDADIAVIPISVAGLRTSRVPAARPAALQLASVAQASAAVSAAQPVEIDPADIPEGTRLVQLGEFDSVEEARAAWDRLAASYPDFFADRSRVVQEVTSGGHSFVRLRAEGFADLMDARRYCTALLAEGSPCIPVTAR
ncbi:SPOR domain-containing protein [Rhodobacterales bacterium HKCCE2091]|nr:SPOR domain-containing protein [Rhodobacterales bacterium HKCCE2091]